MSKLENVGGMPADFAGYGAADEFGVFDPAPLGTAPGRLSSAPPTEMNTARQIEEIASTWMVGSGESSMRGANILTAAEHNRKIVLHAIRARGGITSGELAEVVGLSPPAVFKIVRKLGEEGWIKRSRLNLKARGQPTHALSLNPDAAFSLGLHVDAEHLTLVAVDFAGKVRRRTRFLTPYASPNQLRFFVANALGDLRRETFAPGARIAGLGLALPEDLSSISLRSRSHWHRRWGVKDPVEVLKSLVDTRVVDDSESASAATGEMLFGIGTEVPSFFYLLLGAGLSGGLVINNRFVRGARGRGAEIGLFTKVGARPIGEPDDPEADPLPLATLLKDLAEVGNEGADTGFLDHLNEAGQAVLDRWIDHVADSLYFPLFAMICTVDPNAIVIGGPLPQSVILKLCSKIRKHFSASVGVSWQKTIVKPAAIGTDPAAVGAALLAFPEVWAPNIPWTPATTAAS